MLERRLADESVNELKCGGRSECHRYAGPVLAAGCRVALVVAEVGGLEDRADGHLDAAVERRALEPLDRLIHRLHLPDPVAGDQLLRLCKRPSMMVRCEPENRTLLAFAVGVRPSPASITPALTSSSLNRIDMVAKRIFFPSDRRVVPQKPGTFKRNPVDETDSC